MQPLFVTVSLIICLASRPTLAQTTQPAWEQTDPRVGILSPIPVRGAVPAIVQLLDQPSENELAYRRMARDYEKQIKLICHKYLGEMRVSDLRAQGIEALRSFTDPAAFRPLLEQAMKEKDDVIEAVLDHLSEQGNAGQIALAYAAIYDTAKMADNGHKDRALALRHETTRRMTQPVSDSMLGVLDQALRDTNHNVVNNAGALAGAINAFQTIPLLIFAQGARDNVPETGDLAWIAIQTQTTYVQRLEPIVGDNAAAFAPILGVVTEGVILRVQDAVVITYRTEVHDSLVAMSTERFGESTEHLAYDMNAWWQWYNTQYMPKMNQQTRINALANERGKGDPKSPTTQPKP